MLHVAARAMRSAALRRGAIGAAAVAASTIIARPIVRAASTAAPPAPVASPATEAPAKPAVPVFSTIRSVVLYVYETCPFCNIVRAYLDYARIPYTVVEVNPLTKSEIAFSSDYKKVPLAIINGVRVTDSTTIIDALDQALAATRGQQATAATAASAGGGLRGPTTQGTPAESRWRAWTYDRLVHVVTVNLYRTWGEAWSSFDYLTQQNFAPWSILPTKIVGSVAMVAVAKKMKTKHGIAGDERAALCDELNAFGDAVAAGGQPFLGGAAPNLADLSVYGVLRAIEGIATWRDAMAGSGIAPWYGRMRAAVGAGALDHRISAAPLFTADGVRVPAPPPPAPLQ